MVRTSITILTALAVACCLDVSRRGVAAELAHHGRHAQVTKKAEKKKEGPPPTTPPVRNPAHQFQLVPKDWLELKRQHIVMQKTDYSCGAAALATICKYYWGDNVDEELFLRALDSILTRAEIEDRIKNGLAMSDLRRAAVDVGYQSVVGKTTFEKLTEVKVPVVVGISPEGHDHFVVYRGTDGMWVYVADPIRGNLRMPICEFKKQWQQNAILVVHKPGQKVKTTSPLHVTWQEKQLGKTTNQYIRARAWKIPAQPHQATNP
jgi:predicted double-glycine peptidase